MTPEQLATDLKSLLLQKDFRTVQQPEDTPVFDLYIRIENPVCCVLAVQPHDSDEHREDVAAFAESLQKQLPQIQCTQLICLYLTIGPEPLRKYVLWQTQTAWAICIILHGITPRTHKLCR